jgi:hypothetical protein
LPNSQAARLLFGWGVGPVKIDVIGAGQVPAMSSGLIAIGVAGGVLLLVTLADVFVTIFNYGGFTFLTARFHWLAWRGLRGLASALPAAGREGVLSIGSAAMLPATLVAWLALEISAFAMMYLPGMASGSFTLSGHLQGQIGTAYYLSAGDITSLAFGDVVARRGTYQALADVETAIGLATVGLAVTYVLAALDALASLNRLHGRVRRQATEPNRRPPSSPATSTAASRKNSAVSCRPSLRTWRTTTRACAATRWSSTSTPAAPNVPSRAFSPRSET